MINKKLVIEVLREILPERINNDDVGGKKCGLEWQGGRIIKKIW